MCELLSLTCSILALYTCSHDGSGAVSVRAFRIAAPSVTRHGSDGSATKKRGKGASGAGTKGAASRSSEDGGAGDPTGPVRETETHSGDSHSSAETAGTAGAAGTVAGANTISGSGSTGSGLPTSTRREARSVRPLAPAPVFVAWNPITWFFCLVWAIDWVADAISNWLEHIFIGRLWNPCLRGPWARFKASFKRISGHTSDQNFLSFVAYRYGWISV